MCMLRGEPHEVAEEVVPEGYSGGASICSTVMILWYFFRTLVHELNDESQLNNYARCSLCDLQRSPRALRLIELLENLTSLSA